MRFFLTTTALTAKRMLRRPANLFLAGLLVLFCVIGSLFFGAEQEVLGIRVGVLSHPDDIFAQAVFSRVLAYEGPILFEAYALSDREEVAQLVATGALECAYLIEPDLQSRMTRGRAPGEIVMLYSPRSVADTLSGEMIHAAVLAECVTEMTAELLEEVLDLSPGDALQTAEEEIARFEAQDIFLAPEFRYLSVGAEDPVPAPAPGSRLLHGILAVFLLGGTIWAIPGILRESYIPRALPEFCLRGYRLGIAAALFLLGLGTGLLGLLAIAFVYPAALGELLPELGWLSLYAAALGLGGAAATRILTKEDLVYGGGVFVMILTALLGGMLLDLSEVGPLPGLIGRAFVTTGYLSGVLGSGIPADGIALCALMLLSVIVLLIRPPQKRR